MFFSVTWRTENATRLEKGPISAVTPWSMSRAASELPSSTLFWVSPGSRVIFAPPEGLDPARAVDLVDREEQPVERELRLEGERAGHRQHVADLHLAGLGPPERGRGEGDGGGRAHRGEEAAAPDRLPLGISLVVRHRVLRTGIE